MPLVDFTPEPGLDETVAALRRFNRAHSRFVGALRNDFLGTRWSLLEARIFYELAAHGPVTQTDLMAWLDTDQGYLSRVLRRMRDEGLVETLDDPNDGRRRPMRLSREGRQAFQELDRRSQAEMARRIDGLDPTQRTRLVEALATVQGLLHIDRPEPPATIRRHGPGDIGWVLMRHAELYTNEFHYRDEFEQYVAQGISPFLEGYREEVDGLWIASARGRRIGSVAIQHDPERPHWAKLRWYFVEAEWRHQGMGDRLLKRAVQHARDAGYHGIYLWTMSGLLAARRRYEALGFELVAEAPAPWHAAEVQQKFELLL